MRHHHLHFESVITAKRHTTHLAIVAHQDDAEIIGYSGIHSCFQNSNQWFSAITLTNGGGASRGGKYQNIDNSTLANIRNQEQHKAAVLGEYAFCCQWATDSSYVKTMQQEAISELVEELVHCRPDIIYTHNPFDKHSTHISTMTVVIEALKIIKQSEPDYAPTLYGVEVWGSLDWIPQEYLTELDCSPMPHLEQALIGLFDSQIDGNKGYDKAVLGRREANATFNASHNEDSHRSINLAIELTPLLHSPSLTLKAFVTPILEQFVSQKTNAL